MCSNLAYTSNLRRIRSNMVSNHKTLAVVRGSGRKWLPYVRGPPVTGSGSHVLPFRNRASSQSNHA